MNMHETSIRRQRDHLRNLGGELDGVSGYPEINRAIPLGTLASGRYWFLRGVGEAL